MEQTGGMKGWRSRCTRLELSKAGCLVGMRGCSYDILEVWQAGGMTF